MNNDEAKFILQGYRPGGEDAQNPMFQEALEQARRDPELARWFANEVAIDSRIGAKLKAAVKPPPDLLVQILAQKKIVRPAAWWQKPPWFAGAAAACLASLATVGILWLRSASETQFAGYREAMAEFAGTKMDRLDLKSPDLVAVRQWLTQTNAHGDFVLPAGLNGRPSMGCRVLEWNGHTVSLICFALGNQKMAHLIVIDRAVFGDAPTDSPHFARVGDMATVTWSHGDKTYLIASQGATEQDLVRLL